MGWSIQVTCISLTTTTIHFGWNVIRVCFSQKIHQLIAIDVEYGSSQIPSNLDFILKGSSTQKLQISKSSFVIRDAHKVVKISSNPGDL